MIDKTKYDPDRENDTEMKFESLCKKHNVSCINTKTLPNWSPLMDQKFGDFIVNGHKIDVKRNYLSEDSFYGFEGEYFVFFNTSGESYIISHDKLKGVIKPKHFTPINHEEGRSRGISLEKIKKTFNLMATETWLMTHGE